MKQLLYLLLLTTSISMCTQPLHAAASEPIDTTASQERSIQEQCAELMQTQGIVPHEIHAQIAPLVLK